MKLDLTETKIVGLTMQLELKAMEYKKLCNEFDDLKKKNIDPNSKKLVSLMEKFIDNQEEILKINKELKKLKKEGK